MTRFRISLAILLVLLGISIGSMTAVRHSGNAVLEAVQQVSETASPTAAQCEAVETAWERQNHGCCSLSDGINSWIPPTLSIG